MGVFTHTCSYTRLTFHQVRQIKLKKTSAEEINFQHGVNEAKRGQMKQLVETTFCLHHHQINALAAPAITDLREKRPGHSS